MRVLHLTNAFLPVTENWIHSQIAFNVSVCSSVLCQYRENEAQFAHEAVFACHARRTSPAARADMLLWRVTGRYRPGPARRIMAAVKPDLLHAHFGYVAWGYLAAAHAQGIPLVATFYGVDACMLPRRGAWRRRYAALFEYGAAFIAEGPFLAKTLEALGCPAGKIRCIPIGVDIEALRQAPDRADEGNLRVLFTGLSREKKGPFDAAAAFAAAAAGRPGLRLDLIGDGPFRKPVENRLREAGILDRCTFHGTVTAARYREILKRAAIALAPSVIAANGDAEGGAPVTVIEAQAAGIPVIGTRHCDIPHVVAHGETGLLYAERDAAGLAAGLKRLAGDPDLRTRMGASAAARAAERHDIRKQVEKITAVYAEAAPKKCFSRGS